MGNCMTVDKAASPTTVQQQPSGSDVCRDDASFSVQEQAKGEGPKPSSFTKAMKMEQALTKTSLVPTDDRDESLAHDIPWLRKSATYNREQQEYGASDKARPPAEYLRDKSVLYSSSTESFPGGSSLILFPSTSLLVESSISSSSISSDSPSRSLSNNNTKRNKTFALFRNKTKATGGRKSSAKIPEMMDFPSENDLDQLINIQMSLSSLTGDEPEEEDEDALHARDEQALNKVDRSKIVLLRKQQHVKILPHKQLVEIASPSDNADDSKIDQMRSTQIEQATAAAIKSEIRTCKNDIAEVLREFSGLRAVDSCSLSEAA